MGRDHGGPGRKRGGHRGRQGECERGRGGRDQENAVRIGVRKGRGFMEKILAMALLALCGTAMASAADTPTIGREVGQVFPQIVLPTLDGKRTLMLSGFRG